MGCFGGIVGPDLLGMKAALLNWFLGPWANIRVMSAKMPLGSAIFICFSAEPPRFGSGGSGVMMGWWWWVAVVAVAVGWASSKRCYVFLWILRLQVFR